MPRDSRRVVVPGAGERDREPLFSGDRGSVGEDEEILELTAVAVTAV